MKTAFVWIAAGLAGAASLGLAGAVVARARAGGTAFGDLSVASLSAALHGHPPRRHSLTVPLPPVEDAGGLPPVVGAKDPARPLVVIDPGHGGRDPGAANPDKGYREKDITLALARAVRDELVRQGRVRVALTRDDDRTLMLEDRSDLARRMGADLFLSIHADAADNPDAEGATVYTLSETASDREAEKLAARENRSSVVNGVAVGEQDGAVSSILIDLSRRAAMRQSADFARLLFREAAPTVPFRPIPHRFASLVVLKAPDVPSVLFEAGYITSGADAARLVAPEGRQKIAKGLAQAIAVYFARHNGGQ